MASIRVAGPETMSEEDMDRGYGFTVLVFAERWANEMERRMAEGHVLETIADDAGHTIDRSLGRWGVTGFQYGCAVGLLALCWEHGEALRQWHNLRTQIDHEGERANETGGILNPALLNISDPSEG